MLEFIKDLFGFAKDSQGLVKVVQDEKSKARGTKNRILTEIEFNIDLIFDHYLEREIPAEKKEAFADLKKRLFERMETVDRERIAPGREG